VTVKKNIPFIRGDEAINTFNVVMDALDAKPLF
jgi:hypothetical protein